MPWTEQVAENRAHSAQVHTLQGSTFLPEVQNTGLVDIDSTKPDVVSSVVKTGQEFQFRLKEIRWPP